MLLYVCDIVMTNALFCVIESCCCMCVIYHSDDECFVLGNRVVLLYVCDIIVMTNASFRVIELFCCMCVIS